MASASRSALPALDHQLANRIVEDSIRSYFRKRRSKVPAFVDKTFSFRGALETHRHALGHDLWRAPLNAAMAGPQLGLNVVAGALRLAGRRETAQKLRARELFFRTTVTAEIERRLIVDLLELPHTGAGEPSFHDALAVEILGDRRLDGALGALNGPWGEKQRLKMDEKLAEQIAIYLNARGAAGEVVSAAVTMAAGGALLHQATPGFLTLGPALAQALGAKIGGVAALSVTGAVLAASATAAAFAGVVTDPIQSALGIHHVRLIALLDTLENTFLGGDARLRIPEQYAARLIDLVDALVSIAGHIRA
ncbi:MAG TPA: DUF6635 family protein [Rhizomicrobium sp.]|jgi:hypothetical protein|nr:DUF6635 family protein [Rhizomicrobium sp.]